MKRIICIIAIAVITGTFIFLVVKTQMTVSVDPVTGLQYDGFGRELFPAPYLMRRMGMHDWTGLFWFIIDSIVGWFLAILDYIMITSLPSTKTNDKKTD